MYIYIYVTIYYIYIANKSAWVSKPVNFIQKEGKTNVLVCATFIMKKQAFILEKNVLFC